MTEKYLRAYEGVGKKPKRARNQRFKGDGRKLWIAWQNHRRTSELNKVFQLDLVIYESNLPRIIKYPYLVLKTWNLIRSSRPELLLVQNPSLVLTLLACLLMVKYKYKFIVDAHNAGLLAPVKLLKPLYSLLQKRANITLVSNEYLARLVDSNKGKPYVLPDKIPEKPSVKKLALRGKQTILYICTFADDEPWMEVVNAARESCRATTFYITGDYRKARVNVKRMPSNVILTGFVDDTEYWNLLYSVNLAMDLTLRENCLVCGAYEAVAVGTPMILSETKLLRDYFYKGFIFAENTSESLAVKIQEGLARENYLREDIAALKKELDQSWAERSERLLEQFRL